MRRCGKFGRFVAGTPKRVTHGSGADVAAAWAAASASRAARFFLMASFLRPVSSAATTRDEQALIACAVRVATTERDARDLCLTADALADSNSASSSAIRDRSSGLLTGAKGAGTRGDDAAPTPRSPRPRSAIECLS